MQRFILTLTILAMQAACGGTTPTEFTTAGADVPAEKGRTYRWSFDDVATTPETVSVLGDWKIAEEASAPSAPKVMRQGRRLLTNDFPRVIVKDLVFSDLRLHVSCRPEAGETDQACGLMFRLKDSENYFITRANALESPGSLVATMTLPPVARASS